MDHVLVFDIWGEYAHFRKNYTTTSPLSYSIPPRTALTGLMGAILGLGKDEYLRHSTKEKASFALRLLSPVKKVRISENLIDTKKAGKHMNMITNRTQIRFEFLKDAKYRIYFHHSDDDLYEQAKKLISSHKCVYTPCLGISEHIANFAYVGEFDVKRQTSDDYVSIDSVLPEKSFSEMKFEPGLEYLSESLPFEMTEDRTVTEYGPVVLERNGKPIKAQVIQFWEIETGERIVFL